MEIHENNDGGDNGPRVYFSSWGKSFNSRQRHILYYIPVARAPNTLFGTLARLVHFSGRLQYHNTIIITTSIYIYTLKTILSCEPRRIVMCKYVCTSTVSGFVWRRNEDKPRARNAYQPWRRMRVAGARIYYYYILYGEWVNVLPARARQGKSGFYFFFPSLRVHVRLSPLFHRRPTTDSTYI